MIKSKQRYTASAYFSGALAARLADEMVGPFVLWFSLSLFHSPARGANILALLTFGAVIGGPALGVWIDRDAEPGKVLATALSLFGMGFAILSLSMGVIPTWGSMGLAFVAGTLVPAISGGWSSQIPSGISLTRMSTLDGLTYSIAGLVGPALAGMLYVWSGRVGTISVILACLVVAAFMGASVPERHLKSKVSGRPWWREMLVSLDVIRSNKPLWRATLASTISYAGIGMVWVIVPGLGKAVFGNMAYGGALLSVMAGGAMVGTAVYAARCRTSDIIVGLSTIIMGIAVTGLIWIHYPAIIITAMFGIGVADGLQLAGVLAVRNREAPGPLRGNVFTMGASLKTAAASIGLFWGGHLMGLSLTEVILMASCIQIAAGIGYFTLSPR